MEVPLVDWTAARQNIPEINRRAGELDGGSRRGQTVIGASQTGFMLLCLADSVSTARAVGRAQCARFTTAFITIRVVAGRTAIICAIQTVLAAWSVVAHFVSAEATIFRTALTFIRGFVTEAVSATKAAIVLAGLAVLTRPIAVVIPTETTIRRAVLALSQRRVTGAVAAARVAVQRARDASLPAIPIAPSVVAAAIVGTRFAFAARPITLTVAAWHAVKRATPAIFAAGACAVATRAAILGTVLARFTAVAVAESVAAVAAIPWTVVVRFPAMAIADSVAAGPTVCGA